MPSTINHGGGCCGMRHIAGFGDSNDGGERDSFLASLRNVPIGRLAEVTLIDSQRGWIPQLEAQGFVKTLRFRNHNTGNYVTLFHRHVNSGAAQNEFEVFGADGIPVNVPNAPAVAPGAGVGGNFDIGSRVRYEHAGSVRNGQTGVIEHTNPGGARRIRWDSDNVVSMWLVVGNLRALPVVGVQNAAAPNYPHRFMIPIGTRVQLNDATEPRHGVIGVVEQTNRDGIAYIRPDGGGDRIGYFSYRLRPASAQPVPVPEPARQEPREIARFFHCVYRDDRRGAGYDTLEAAVEANPRVRRVDAQVIMSDGNRRWEERVNG